MSGKQHRVRQARAAVGYPQNVDKWTADRWIRLDGRAFRRQRETARLRHGSASGARRPPPFDALIPGGDKNAHVGGLYKTPSALAASAAAAMVTFTVPVIITIGSELESPLGSALAHRPEWRPSTAILEELQGSAEPHGP